MKIAIIDVDTSHAWVLGNYLRLSGRAAVTHVVDSGLCWPAAHTQRIAGALGATVCESVDDLADEIDGALLLGADYADRLDRAAPLIKAGVPLFFDKPAAGTIAQVCAAEALLRTGYPLLSGSSLPYCPELARVARVVQGGAPSAVAVYGCREFMEHGIHAADVAMSIVQAPVRRVSWTPFGASELLWVETDSPTHVSLALEAAANWCVVGNGPAGNTSVNLNLSFHRECHYARLISSFLDMVERKPIRFGPRWHLEAIRLLIAGQRARETGGVVCVDDLKPEDGFDGRRYGAEYADICRNSDHSNGKLEPDADVFGVPLTMAGKTSLTSWDRLRMNTRDRAVRLLGERGKRVVKKMLLRT